MKIEATGSGRPSDRAYQPALTSLPPPGDVQKPQPDRDTLVATDKPDEGKVRQATERLNKMVEAFNTQLRFSVHKGTGEIMVKVVDSKTGDVIREIPPEKVLDAVARMEETLGILLDARV